MLRHGNNCGKVKKDQHVSFADALAIFFRLLVHFRKLIIDPLDCLSATCERIHIGRAIVRYTTAFLFYEAAREVLKA